MLDITKFNLLYIFFSLQNNKTSTTTGLNYTIWRIYSSSPFFLNVPHHHHLTSFHISASIWSSPIPSLHHTHPPPLPHLYHPPASHLSIWDSLYAHSSLSCSSIIFRLLSTWVRSERGGRVASNARLRRALSIITTSGRPAGRPCST